MKHLALATVRLPHADLARLEQASQALEAGTEEAGVFGLATCQRVLACTLAEQPRQALSELAEGLAAPGAERFVGMDAFTHLARVAASLDALVPGEDQVPAQFRQRLADREHDLEAELLEELQRVRSIARQARDAGGLRGHQGRSIVDLARRLLPAEGPLAVLGTGTIAEEAVEAFADERPVHVASRSLDRARALADEERAWTRESMFRDPPPLAGVLVCTGCEEGYLIGEEAGRRLAQARTGTTLRLVDLGVPRNVEPELRRTGGLELATLADLAALASSTPDDDRVARARKELSQRLAVERQRRRSRELDERVVALREGLAEELADLSEDGQAWLEEAHGSLAHTAQRHLEAALRGEAPP